MMAALHRQLIPFNYVVPGQSVNHLIDFANFVEATDALRTLRDDLQSDKKLEKKLDRAAALPVNEFSAKDYRIVNFIADLPIRVDGLVAEGSVRPPRTERNPRPTGSRTRWARL